MPSQRTLFEPNDHGLRLLAENHAVLSLVAGRETLLNASLESVLLQYEEDGLVIELALLLRHSASVSKLLLCFEQVSAYAFAYSMEVSFYNVVSYKLLPVETGYYLSLDPYDETQEVDERDNDCIVATRIKAYAFVVV
jgi:hypothetical protein